MFNAFLKTKILFACIACFLILSNCSKRNSNNTPADPVVFFDNNVINKDLTIHLAVDNGSTLTAQYNGYTLRFSKNGATSGTLSIVNSLLSYSGTWSTTTDHTMLTIVMPTPPTEFTFLNRQWKFTRYSTPIMELAPASSGDSKVLHFQVQ